VLDHPGIARIQRFRMSFLKALLRPVF
jgi:hypothetical protein